MKKIQWMILWALLCVAGRADALDLDQIACGGSQNQLGQLIHGKYPLKLVFAFEGLGGYAPKAAARLRNLDREPHFVEKEGPTAEAFLLQTVKSLMPRALVDPLPVRVLYFASDQWKIAADCAETLARVRHAGPTPFHTLVGVGYSNGARSIFQWAKRLEARQIKVDAAITIDPIRKVGEKMSAGLNSKDAYTRQANVGFWANYYQSNDVPVPLLFRGSPLDGKLPGDFEMYLEKANHLTICHTVKDRVLEQISAMPFRREDYRYVRAAGVSPTQSCSPQQEISNLDELEKLSHATLSQNPDNAKLQETLGRIQDLESNEAKVDAYAALIGIRRLEMDRQVYMREMAAFAGMRDVESLYKNAHRYPEQIRRYHNYLEELQKNLGVSKESAQQILRDLHSRFSAGI